MISLGFSRSIQDADPTSINDAMDVGGPSEYEASYEDIDIDLDVLDGKEEDPPDENMINDAEWTGPQVVGANESVDWLMEESIAVETQSKTGLEARRSIEFLDPMVNYSSMRPHNNNLEAPALTSDDNHVLSVIDTIAPSGSILVDQNLSSGDTQPRMPIVTDTPSGVEVTAPLSHSGIIYDTQLDTKSTALQPSGTISTLDTQALASPLPIAQDVNISVDSPSSVPISIKHVNSDDLQNPWGSGDTVEPEKTSQKVDIESPRSTASDVAEVPEPGVRQRTPFLHDSSAATSLVVDDGASQAQEEHLEESILPFIDEKQDQAYGDDTSIRSNKNKYPSQFPTKGMQKLHPVTVDFLQRRYLLLPVADIEIQQAVSVFLDEAGTTFASVRDILTACRERIGEAAINNDLELCFDDIGLILTETCALSQSVSLSQLLDVYLKLLSNDNQEIYPPLHCTLHMRKTDTQCWKILQQMAVNGHGISEIPPSEISDSSFGVPTLLQVLKQSPSTLQAEPFLIPDQASKKKLGTDLGKFADSTKHSHITTGGDNQTYDSIRKLSSSSELFLQQGLGKPNGHVSELVGLDKHVVDEDYERSGSPNDSNLAEEQLSHGSFAPSPAGTSDVDVDTESIDLEGAVSELEESMLQASAGDRPQRVVQKISTLIEGPGNLNSEDTSLPIDLGTETSVPIEKSTDNGSLSAPVAAIFSNDCKAVHCPPEPVPAATHLTSEGNGIPAPVSAILDVHPFNNSESVSPHGAHVEISGAEAEDEIDYDSNDELEPEDHGKIVVDAHTATSPNRTKRSLDTHPTEEIDREAVMALKRARFDSS